MGKVILILFIFISLTLDQLDANDSSESSDEDASKAFAISEASSYDPDTDEANLELSLQIGSTNQWLEKRSKKDDKVNKRKEFGRLSLGGSSSSYPEPNLDLRLGLFENHPQSMELETESTSAQRENQSSASLSELTVVEEDIENLRPFNIDLFLSEFESDYYFCSVNRYKKIVDRAEPPLMFINNCSYIWQKWVDAKIEHLYDIGKAILIWMEALSDFFVSEKIHLKDFFGQENLRLYKGFEVVLEKKLPKDTFIRDYLNRALTVGDGICLHLRFQPLSDLESIIGHLVSTSSTNDFLAQMEFEISKPKPEFPSYFLLFGVQHICHNFYKHRSPLINYSSYNIPTNPNSAGSREFYLETERGHFYYPYKEEVSCNWVNNYRITRLSYEAKISGRDVSDVIMHYCSRCELFSYQGVDDDRYAKDTISTVKRSMRRVFKELTLKENECLLDILRVRGSQSQFSDGFFNVIKRRSTPLSGYKDRINLYLNGSALCDFPLGPMEMFSTQNSFLKTIELYANMFSLVGFKPDTVTLALSFFMQYLVCQTTKILTIRPNKYAVKETPFGVKSELKRRKLSEDLSR